MSGVKKAGGILSLVGGTFMFIMVFINASAAFAGSSLPYMLPWIVFLGTASLAAVGGILGIINKRLGGILTLIGIGMALVISFSLTPDLSTPPLCDYSLIVHIYHSIGISSILCTNITVDGILMLAGGIMIVVSGSE